MKKSQEMQERENNLKKEMHEMQNNLKKEMYEKLDDKDKQISSQEELLKNQEEQHKKDLERIAELEAKLNSINNSSNNI